MPTGNEPLQSVQVIRYLPSTGQITGAVTCAPAISHNMAIDDEAYVIVEDVAPLPLPDTTHYVQGGKLVRKTACPAVLDGYVLRELPVPCRVSVDMTTYACEDDTAAIEIDQPGTYTITVRAVPHLDGVFALTV